MAKRFQPQPPATGTPLHGEAARAAAGRSSNLDGPEHLPSVPLQAGALLVFRVRPTFPDLPPAPLISALHLPPGSSACSHRPRSQPEILLMLPLHLKDQLFTQSRANFASLGNRAETLMQPPV